MLILSQDKKTIYNLDNFEFIYTWYGSVCLNNWSENISRIELAHYNECYEKAEEILADIIKKAEVGCNTYIMPEE